MTCTHKFRYSVLVFVLRESTAQTERCYISLLKNKTKKNLNLNINILKGIIKEYKILSYCADNDDINICRKFLVFTII